MKKILYIGSLDNGSTCYERMKAFADLGHTVIGINIVRPVSPLIRLIIKILRYAGQSFDFVGLNQDIKKAVLNQPIDIVWIDKGTLVKPATLLFVKQRQSNCLLVHLNPDDPFGMFRKGWNIFLKAIPHYDVHFVARVQNVEEYARLGGRNIYLYDRSYSSHLHRPVELSEEDQAEYNASVGFIGSYAPARAGMIAFLIQNDIPVAVYGDGWEQCEYWDIIRPNYRGRSRYGEAYVKTINGMGIALHFLRHENRDEQDSRTFEIPACGVFMLAERSRKHEEFFRENEEAVFFDTAAELLEKVRYYLDHPEAVKRIAAAGRRRCIESGYDHHSRMKKLLETALNTKSE